MKKGLKDQIFNYNDYELLYLAHLETEEAKSLLFEKYLFLIRKKLKSFNVPYKLWSDYEQEGMIMINKAIKTYKESSKMSFTKYLEMLLEHRIIDLERKRKMAKVDAYEYDEIEYLEYFQRDVLYLKEDIVFEYEVLSNFEKEIFELKFIKGLKTKEISEILKIDAHKIYSATDRIRKKVRLKNN